MKFFIKRFIPWWLLITSLCIATGVVWQASRWAYAVELESMVNTGKERLTLYTGTLRGALSRYAYLPYVLANNGAVQELLKSGGTPTQVNQYLEELNQEAGCQTLYVMDTTGRTLASSNWREPLSYVDKNYGFRPYFTAAKEGRRGHFFAIGVTTSQPGFFMSHPVYQKGRFLGAVVVKVDLNPLQDDWREGGETVLVSDANGVLFLSSRNDWRYHSLSQLSTEQRERIRAGRQYGTEPLDLVPLHTKKWLGDEQRIVQADKLSYLMLSRSIPGLDWTLFHLAPLAPVQERTQAVATIGTILSLLVLALGMYARERRQKQLSRHKAREAEAIKTINLRLQGEIEEHCRTEHALRNTQAELVQSSKLAALGQMAAGIVHELNQPIAAMRTHSASGRLLLDRHEVEKARESFASITRITDHMASITAQLKIFAYKTPRQSEPVLVQDCLSGAQAMTEALLAEVDVVLETQQPTKPVIINGDRSQQFPATP
ncbi:MAG: hypothetical protein L3J63_13370 [Geopsychrobacter sp.]|nr:hypothetical protein [Geopsychrobacter sp.]